MISTIFATLISFRLFTNPSNLIPIPPTLFFRSAPVISFV